MSDKPTHKVIGHDNFGRDTVSDKLICDNCSEHWATIIAKMLNEKYGGDHASWFYEAVPVDYKLYRYEP